MNINRLPFVVFLLLVGCTDGSDLCSFKEVKSEVSGSVSVKAVVMIKNCGATTSEAYHIFLSPMGDSIDEENPIFVADNVDDLKMLWRSESELLVTYSSARIFHFKNFYYFSEGGPEAQIISILEIKE